MPLRSRLLLDNWTLSAAEDLLTKGCDAKEAPTLWISEDRKDSEWRHVPAATIQTAALVRTLVDIVTRDELVVEPRYLFTWGHPGSPLLPLRDDGIVVGEPIPGAAADAAALTSEIVHRLCVTPALSQAQEANEASWEDRRDIVNSPQSVILWGAAGYLMRSHLLSLPYSGHPLRTAALERTLLFDSNEDVTRGVERWLSDQRRTVFETLIPGSRSTSGVVLPPFAVEIINSSATAHDLIPTALQVRDEYKELRTWLAEYQNAVDTDNPLAMTKKSDILRSVEDHVARRLKRTVDGGTAVSLSVAWVGVSSPAFAPVEYIRNKTGVRALLNRLVFAERGRGTLRRLVDLLGEGRSTLGRIIVATLPDYVA